MGRTPQGYDGTMPDQMLIGFNPMSAANRVAYYSRQIRSRLLWLVVAIVICIWIWLWQRGTLSVAQGGMLLGLGVLYSLVWLMVAVINWSRAKSALSAVSPGVAVAIDRTGIWFASRAMAWPEISQVCLLPGRFGGSPNLAVTTQDGQVTRMSVADLDTMPGTIDAAIRSYSAGSQWIDTSKLGN